MKYNFSEKILAPNFRKDITDQIEVLISTGSSFNIIGMPFVGISPFFRYLATTSSSYSIYTDVHALSNRKKEDLFLAIYKELGGTESIPTYEAFDYCKEILKELLSTQKKVVLMINRFDYLEKSEYSNGIFTNLKALEDIGKGRVIFVVATSKPLYEIDEAAISDSNLAFFSKIVFFPPYYGEDLKKLLLISPTALKPEPKDLRTALDLSGGHATLLQVLIKTDFLNDPFSDPFIKLHLKVIYDACSTKQKNILYKLAVGSRLKEIDPFLIKIGIIKEINGSFYVFSPLFRTFLINYVKLKFSKKEKVLFTLLKKHLGRTVLKDQIFQELWKEDFDKPTDWALNSLVYRLRKNPTVINNKYIIENEKDIGYKLLKGN